MKDITSSGARTDQGSASVWALLLTAGAFTLLFGLVVDGGSVIDARIDAARVAAQAARLGADQLSEASVRNGGDDVAARAATAHVLAYLRAAHMRGSVHTAGSRVTVTVDGSSRNEILSVIGIDSFPIHETRTAGAIHGARP